MKVLICFTAWLYCACAFSQSYLAGNELIQRYAQRMNVSDSMLRITELYAAIDEWIGTPYRYGRSDRQGTDCSGFVGNIYSPLCGEKLPRSAAGIAHVVESKPINDLQEGDLVFFNYRSTNSHVGIYLQNGWFVHASVVRGVTLNNLRAAYYARHFSKGGALKRGQLRDLMPPRTASAAHPQPRDLLMPKHVAHFGRPPVNMHLRHPLHQ